VSTDAPPVRRRSPVALAIQGGLAIGVSVALFAWAFRDVSMAAVLAEMRHTDLSALLLYVAAQFVIHGIRTVRWGLLLAPLGKPTPRAVFAAASVGLPAAVFLPLRLGEVVRPVMISRAGVPLASGMASVVVERVADGLTNVGLFFVLLAFLPATAQLPEELRALSRLALVGFGGGLVFLMAASFAREWALGLVSRVLTPISSGLAGKVLSLLSSFLDGIAALASPGRVLGFLLLTAAYWGVNGVTTAMLARSFGMDVSPLAGVFTVSVVVFAVMIPSGPAFAGTLEAGIRLGLTPFGARPESVAVLALTAHATQLAIMALLAGLGFLLAEPSQR
jgi:uncharacterized protein (TIRG00374 family)